MGIKYEVKINRIKGIVRMSDLSNQTSIKKKRMG